MTESVLDITESVLDIVQNVQNRTKRTGHRNQTYKIVTNRNMTSTCMERNATRASPSPNKLEHRDYYY